MIKKHHPHDRGERRLLALKKQHKKEPDHGVWRKGNSIEEDEVKDLDGLDQRNP